MRSLLSVFAAALLLVGVTGVAHAAPLKWDGTLMVDIGDLPPIIETGSGVATVNGSGGLGHLNQIRLDGGITGTTTVPVTDPEALPIVAVAVTATGLGPGSLGQISGGGALSPNTLAIRGQAKVCLFDPSCFSALKVNLTTHTAGSTTVGVGLGGMLTIGGVGAIRISVIGNPWTLGTATSLDQTDNQAFVTLTSMGTAFGPLGAPSSTAVPGGVVKFITPLQVSTNLTFGSVQKIALFTTLTLHFVPEPGMLLLLGSGVVGLVLLGRHRMKE